MRLLSTPLSLRCRLITAPQFTHATPYTTTSPDEPAAADDLASLRRVAGASSARFGPVVSSGGANFPKSAGVQSLSCRVRRPSPVPRLRRTLGAPCTTAIRELGSEVVLEPDTTLSPAARRSTMTPPKVSDARYLRSPGS